MITETAVAIAVTNDEYHRDLTRDSSSSLNLFRQSRERYEAERILGTMEPDPPTPAMEFGSMFHALMLEKDVFDSLYCVWESQDKRTKDGKASWERCVAMAAGRTICKSDDYELAAAMRDGVMRNPMARKLMELPGVNERPIFWSSCGVNLKCKPDRLLDANMVADLKTTDDISPEAFGRTVFNFGYHRQAALYLDGIRATMAGADHQFIFVVVSKSPPHETAVYVLSEQAMELGHAENQKTLEELAECRLRGNFTGRWSDRIIPLDLPRWAFQRGVDR